MNTFKVKSYDKTLLDLFVYLSKKDTTEYITGETIHLVEAEKMDEILHVQ